MKRGLVLVILLIGIYIALSFWVNHGHFMGYTCLRSGSKAESIERGMYINKKIILYPTGDSVVSNLSNFEIWQDKDQIVETYGYFRFLYRTISYDNSALINIRAKNTPDNWLIQFNNENDLYGFACNEHYAKLNNDSLLMTFYKIARPENIEMGKLKIKWE